MIRDNHSPTGFEDRYSVQTFNTMSLVILIGKMVYMRICVRDFNEMCSFVKMGFFWLRLAYNIG